MVQQVETTEHRAVDCSSLPLEEILSKVAPRAPRSLQLTVDCLLTRSEIRAIRTVSTDVGLEVAEEQNRKTVTRLMQWLQENGLVISHDHSEPHYTLSMTKWEALLKWMEGEKSLSARVSRFDRRKHPWE